MSQSGVHPDRKGKGPAILGRASSTSSSTKSSPRVSPAPQFSPSSGNPGVQISPRVQAGPVPPGFSPSTGGSTPQWFSSSSVGSTPSGGSTPPLKTTPHVKDNKMDPSNVLASPGNETLASQAGDEMSLVEFVMYRCQNVVRISANNNPTFQNERQGMEEDLKIYLAYNRGLKALLPSRPRPTETRETELENKRSSKRPLKSPNYEVFANHFQITMPPQHEFQVYKVEFGNEDETGTVGGPGKVLTGTFIEYSNKSKWEKIVREFGQDPEGINGIRPVYDGGGYMVSHKPFAWPAEVLKRGVKLRSQDQTVEVTITLKAPIDMDNFHNFLNNTKRCTFPKDVVQLVLTVVRQYCATKGYIPSDRFCFEKAGGEILDDWDPRTRQPGPKLFIAKTGYFQSVRVLGGGLQLNVDAMRATFYKPGLGLIDAWAKLVGYYLREDRDCFVNDFHTQEWNEMQARIATRHWKNLQIDSTHAYDPRAPGNPGRIVEWPRDEQFSCYKVTSVAAKSTQVTGDYSFRGIHNNKAYTAEGSGRFQGNLINFISERYGKNADDLLGNLPAIKVSKSKDQYLPWGCCLTSNASRYSGTIGPELRTKLEKAPGERQKDIQDWMAQRIEHSRDGDHRPWAEKLFDVAVSKEMIKVEALILDKPFLLMRGADRGLQRLSYFQERHYFRMGDHLRMLEPIRMASWAVLSFDPEGCNCPWKDAFIEELRHKMKLRGLTGGPQEPLGDPVQKISYQVNTNNSIDQRRQQLRRRLEDIFGRFPRITILICFMSRKLNPEYATLKSDCDRIHGVPTQVVITSRLTDKSRSRIRTLVDNVLWKINVKCGGKNFRVGSLQDIDIMRPERNTILMGADVTHGSPSIAAVVATTDYEAVNYATRIRSQNPNEEKIEHLQAMVGDLLEVYQTRTSNWPDHIIFFRDGVSETQYLDTLRYEGTQILQAAREKYAHKMPKLFIILAVKRHHTRFFKKNNLNKFENIEDGTVVHDGVTHPREYEFFLCSHRPIGFGTARPTKYHVLVDQIELDPEELYKLIFYLCFSFQRCQKAVALVTPVSYAHLAAFRAKLYMDCYVSENPRPGDRLEQIDWLRKALLQDLNAHPNLRDRLWFL